MEGPGEFEVLNNEGNLNLRNGQAFFEVASGGRGLEVHTPSAILRDIGTTFGVRVMDQVEEVHVFSGAVEIRHNERSLGMIAKGGAASFKNGEFRSMDLRHGAFLSKLPSSVVLLSDDFGDGTGTKLKGKPTDRGGRWKVLKNNELQRVRLQDGVLDTSGGSKTLAVHFASQPQGQPVYMLRLKTVPPSAVSKEGSLAATLGAERICLTTNGEPILGLGGRATSSGHTWFIEKGVEENPRSLTDISVFNEEELTLRYDSRTGVADLIRATDSGKSPVSSRKVAKGLVFDGLIVMNHGMRGDVALDKLEVEAVIYPE